jgi:PDZ domain-containing secreted protein
MNITKTNNLIEVEGVIKTMNDANKLNDVLNEFKEGDSVTIKIKDSFAMPSAVIGTLLKKAGDGVKIKLEVHNDILYEVLDDLNLGSEFDIKKI